jgi:HEPN domain-containing protein
MKKAVNNWLKYARRDLLTAKNLSQSKIFLAEPIAFHAQQTAEKAIKAFLAFHSKRFPKTHEILKLLRLMNDINPELASRLDRIAVLTEYAVSYRYPEAARKKMTKARAKNAVKLAEFALNEIRAELSKIK